MEITVILKAEPALMALLENLGNAFLVTGQDVKEAAEILAVNPTPAQTTQIIPAQAPAPIAPMTPAPSTPAAPVTPPMTNPAPVAPTYQPQPVCQAPVAPATPAPVVPAVPAVPTAPARTYSMSELGVAGADLAASGKRDQLIGLLQNQFGVQALTQLPPERYPEFAQGLRALGAKI